MATMNKQTGTSGQYYPAPPETEILIERRETIGIVKPGPGGSVNPLEPVFQLIAEYLPNNLADAELNIGFTAFNRRFTVHVDEWEPLPSETR